MQCLLALAGFADPADPQFPESSWSLAQFVLDKSALVLVFSGILGTLLIVHQQFLAPLHEGYRKTIYGATTLGIILSMAYSFVLGVANFIFNS